MTYYARHVFMCVNRRDDGSACCAARDSEARLKELRRLLKTRGAHGRGKIRVNKSGCMDRCARGPILVVYPDAVWYRYENARDLEEIADSHLRDGNIVARLRLDD
jgi:(2Fe-2S) ferredoxin